MSLLVVPRDTFASSDCLVSLFLPALSTLPLAKGVPAHAAKPVAISRLADPRDQRLRRPLDNLVSFWPLSRHRVTVWRLSTSANRP